MKTAELTGYVLNTWVAKAEGKAVVMRRDTPAEEFEFEPEGPAHEFSLKEWKMWRYYRSSTDWAQGGPIIERERIDLEWEVGFTCEARAYSNGDVFTLPGETPLIAAMRAYVTSKFGAEVSDA